MRRLLALAALLFPLTAHAAFDQVINNLDAGNATINGTLTTKGVTDTGAVTVLGVLNADAGYCENLTVNGTLTAASQLSTFVNGTLNLDAGIYGTMSGTLFSGDAGYFGNVWSNSHFYLNQSQSSPVGLALCLDNGCNVTISEDIVDTMFLQGGVQIGQEGIGGSTIVTNFVAGQCNLSNGQCSTALVGAQGNSLCVASVQGNAAFDSGACAVRPDAGSATINCQAAGNALVAVMCWN